MRTLLALLVVYAGVSFGHLAIQEGRLWRDAQILAAEQARVDRLGRALREEIRYVQTPQGVEQLAREELGLAMPGEVTVQPCPLPVAGPIHRNGPWEALASTCARQPALLAAFHVPTHPAASAGPTSAWSRAASWVGHPRAAVLKLVDRGLHRLGL